VDHRNDAAFQDAKRDEALLTVGKTIIFQGDGMAVEEPLGAQEIKAVLPEFSVRLASSHVTRTWRV
jgi:hypothetical protein